MRQERRMANGYGIFSLWMNWIMGVGSLVAVLLLSPHIDKMWLPLVVFMLEFISLEIIFDAFSLLHPRSESEASLNSPLSIIIRNIPLSVFPAATSFAVAGFAYALGITETFPSCSKMA